MANRKFKSFLKLFLTALLLGLTAFVSPSDALVVKASYLYTLSDFTGAVPYGGGSLFVDRDRNEAYVLYQNNVRVFNSSGLEIYRFGDNRNLGIMRDLAVEEDGSILVLSYTEGGDQYEVIRCNFRGEPVAKIEVTDLLPAFRGIRPDHIAYHQGKIYLADSSQLLAVIIDKQGHVEKSFDFYDLLDLKENERNKNKNREDTEMDGFTVARDGSMLFTIPVLFTACRVSLDGTASTFGKPGSIAGKFGIVSAIVEDNRGNILVADKLKCLVNVYDKNYRFLLEFGYRGDKPENMIVPQGLAVDSNDRVYVVQAGYRGVSVFRMNYN